ncbi:hypothetical protein LTR37_016743 [Vermiconidia calcicola]|uniref:Uncharacterized protein n=1 Tax=Vermiconidia calcicola TaxID=1690605 RepID=A0ACC3MM18_9PEZI|nr:hypothetical protein LTR37_016743 [Vermiconidia calcicola]
MDGQAETMVSTIAFLYRSIRGTREERMKMRNEEYDRQNQRFLARVARARARISAESNKKFDETYGSKDIASLLTKWESSSSDVESRPNAAAAAGKRVGVFLPVDSRETDGKAYRLWWDQTFSESESGQRARILAQANKVFDEIHGETESEQFAAEMKLILEKFGMGAPAEAPAAKRVQLVLTNDYRETDRKAYRLQKEQTERTKEERRCSQVARDLAEANEWFDKTYGTTESEEFVRDLSLIFETFDPEPPTEPAAARKVSLVLPEDHRETSVKGYRKQTEMKLGRHASR